MNCVKSVCFHVYRFAAKNCRKISLFFCKQILLKHSKVFKIFKMMLWLPCKQLVDYVPFNKYWYHWRQNCCHVISVGCYNFIWEPFQCSKYVFTPVEPNYDFFFGLNSWFCNLFQCKSVTQIFNPVNPQQF